VACSPYIPVFADCPNQRSNPDFQPLLTTKEEDNMKLKHTLTALAAALVLNAQATEFRSAEVHPDDYPTTLAVKHMSETLKKLTNGKHGINVFSGGKLGSEKDAIEQTKIGAIAMTRVNSAPMNNICPATLVPTMPFLFHSTEHMRKVLDGAIGDEIAKDCEAQGFVVLAFYDSGSRSIYSVKKPVKTLADVKGMKIRVQQSDLWVALLEAMGANATPMPYGEVYTALKTSLVDAAENNYPSYESSRHYEVAKYYAKTEHSMAPEVLLFSKRVWDTLSADDQKALRQAAKESVPYMRKLWDEREAKSLATVKAGGALVTEIDKTAFQAAMKPVYDKFITDPKLKDMVKRIQDIK
jgi:tripartite ATP-independent transporter DctP family solute receptor